MTMANKFINLEEIVLNWAWKQYDLTATTRKQKTLRSKERKCANKYIGVKIDWSEVRFTDKTKWSQLDDDKQTEADTSSPVYARQLEASQDRVLGPRSSVLFHTRFTNNTNDVQEYTMRADKTTKSSISTSVESGFTRGFDMSIKLASPCQVFEANAGYKREFSLTNVEGETFEEELSWGVESLIRVNAQHVADASLVVEEKRQNGSFEIETRIRGSVYVTFTALRDNNSLIKSVSHDIGSIVQEFLTKEKRKAGGSPTIDWVIVTEDDVVVIKTRGSCKFRYGIKQEIHVNQTNLSQVGKL